MYESAECNWNLFIIHVTLILFVGIENKRCIINIQDISSKKLCFECSDFPCNDKYWSVQVIFHVVKYAYIFKIYALSIECYSLHLKRHKIFFFHPRVIFGVRWKLFPFNYLIVRSSWKLKGSCIPLSLSLLP